MRFLLPLLLLVLAVPAEARLSREERAMAAAVDREAERTVALLERLVNQNSGTLNLEGVTAVGRMMRDELEPLGLRGPLGRHARDRPRRPSRRHPSRARAATSC